MTFTFTNPLIPYRGDVESAVPNNLFSELLGYVNTVAGPSSLVFPADSTANKFLKTNGSGTLSFANVVRSSADLYNDEGIGAAGQFLASDGDGTAGWRSVSVTTPWSEETTSPLAAAPDGRYIIKNSAAFTVTLPGTPSVGDEILFTAGDGVIWGTNHVTLDRNGSKIEGVAANYVLYKNGEYRALYVGATTGWRIIEVAGNFIPTGDKIYADYVGFNGSDTLKTLLDISPTGGGLVQGIHISGNVLTGVAYFTPFITIDGGLRRGLGIVGRISATCNDVNIPLWIDFASSIKLELAINMFAAGDVGSVAATYSLR